MISIAIEPCPVATSKSSNGCTNVSPCSFASFNAYSQASSYTLPYNTTSAPYPLVLFTLISGVVVGITTVALTPYFFAA